MNPLLRYHQWIWAQFKLFNFILNCRKLLNDPKGAKWEITHFFVSDAQNNQNDISMGLKQRESCVLCLKLQISNLIRNCNLSSKMTQKYPQIRLTISAKSLLKEWQQQNMGGIFPPTTSVYDRGTCPPKSVPVGLFADLQTSACQHTELW